MASPFNGAVFVNQIDMIDMTLDFFLSVFILCKW